MAVNPLGSHYFLVLSGAWVGSDTPTSLGIPSPSVGGTYAQLTETRESQQSPLRSKFRFSASHAPMRHKSWPLLARALIDCASVVRRGLVLVGAARAAPPLYCLIAFIPLILRQQPL